MCFDGVEAEAGGADGVDEPLCPGEKVGGDTGVVDVGAHCMNGLDLETMLGG